METSADFKTFASDAHISGTTAVLTVTNEQALQVAHLLQRQGKHVRLIQATDVFRFINLAEIRYFLKQIAHTEDGSISPEEWETAKHRTEQTYANSKLISAVRCFFKEFETTHQKYYRSDLREFTLESSIEDFISTDNNTVFVSTIHKAKGREFDTVHLLLGGVREMDADMQRAVYVGITRARHSLLVYKDISLLALQPSIVLSLSMHDVRLDYFRNKKEKVLGLRSGDKLKYNNGYLISLQGDYIASLSTDMRKHIKEYEDKGYIVTYAEVSFIIAWRPREEQQEEAVCLANLILESTDKVENKSYTHPE